MDYNLNNIKDKILWVCPTRGRPEKLQKMIDSWKEQSEGLSDLLIAIDDDDRSNDSLILQNDHPNILWEIGESPGRAFLKLFNRLSMKYANHYKYIGFMEDDCVFKTKYESQFIQKLKELGPLSLCHANDLINAPRLCSLPCFSSSLIRKIGFAAPPELNALWCDYWWAELKNYGAKEYYFPNIIIQHVHYSVVDNVKDITSVEMEIVAQQDFPAYRNYRNSQKFLDDMKRITS